MPTPLARQCCNLILLLCNLVSGILYSDQVYHAHGSSSFANKDVDHTITCSLAMGVSNTLSCSGNYSHAIGINRQIRPIHGGSLMRLLIFQCVSCGSAVVGDCWQRSECPEDTLTHLCTTCINRYTHMVCLQAYRLTTF